MHVEDFGEVLLRFWSYEECILQTMLLLEANDGPRALTEEGIVDYLVKVWVELFVIISDSHDIDLLCDDRRGLVETSGHHPGCLGWLIV